jgi:hypothetical protein
LADSDIDKFGRTKEEVIQLRRDGDKRRRDKRSQEKKEADNNVIKQWRDDSKKYVSAFDHLRRQEKVDAYTQEQVEEARIYGRNQWHR